MAAIRLFFFGSDGKAACSLHGVVVKVDAAERLFNAAQCSCAFVWLKLAFPNLNDVPSQPTQSYAVTGVTILVALNLLLPEARVGLWQPEVATALVSVPEATVHENHGAIAPQHNVWTTR